MPPRQTRVREHSRSNAAHVREHLRDLGPKDVRDILARPYANYLASHALENFTGDVDERVQAWIAAHPDASIGEIDSVIVDTVLGFGRELPPAQQVEVIDRLRAYYRDPTTEADVATAVKAIAPYFKHRPSSADEVEVLMDRALDSATDALHEKHTFVRPQHEQEVETALERLRSHYESELEGEE